MNNAFEVEGGHKLKGEIIPQGAKNEALQVLCAVLLTEEKVTIHNIPDILDVNLLIQLLSELGVDIRKKSNHTYTFEAKNINLEYLNSTAFRRTAVKLRGSVMIIGPLLTRFKKAFIPKPGGDKIGRRRLDTHFHGFEKLGARFNYDVKDEVYYVDASALKGCYILLDEPSVTGTANVIMTAVMAKGTTTIFNAGCEPYIQQLCKMLISMGAKIEGVGSNRVLVHGVDSLGGCEHTILPDMIEIGSFIGMAAMTASDLTIKNVGFEYLGQIPMVFERLGINFELKGDDLHIPPNKEYEVQHFMDGSTMTIADGPWPLFTPDLISIILVVATQARGSVLIHQKMFESRLFFVDKLIDMGAQIILCDPHRAVVIGLDKKYPLRSIQMSSPDIRAGVAMLIAALSAEGTSVIYNSNQIDRGYQYIDKRLQNIGAKIKRI